MSDNLSKLIVEIYKERLEEFTGKATPLTSRDITEVFKIQTAINADRPTGDMVMTVIFNAFTFLHKDYPLQSDEEFQHIMTFLEAFHHHTQTDFLSKVSTQKDGLAMQVTSTD